MATHQLEFYRARADEARADAAAATLAHVRERCERSLAAWTALADRAEHAGRMRVQEEERKAAVKADAAEEAEIAEEERFEAEQAAIKAAAPLAV
jgi:hypothetical protein